MMKPLTVCIGFAAVLLILQADDLTSRYDREVFAVVRWEILWNQLPSGSHVPSSGVATKFAVQRAQESLSYCSHELGVCETYRIGGYRNWEEVANALCNDKRSDKEALRAFVNISPPAMVESGPSPRFVSKHGGFTGVPTERFGIIWTTETTLGSLPEIIQQYKQMHPPQLGALEHWLRTPPTADPGTRIKVPCFAPTDPLIFLSVTTSRGEPMIETVFWNREAETWESADGFGPPADPVALSTTLKTIDSTSCASVVF